ncbi:hypothetical protein GQR58_026232 [Nymphon striatum]|nr:hypothetical protein GQR58_026232 [Nymphon striatum]
MTGNPSGVDNPSMTFSSNSHNVSDDDEPFQLNQATESFNLIAYAEPKLTKLEAAGTQIYHIPPNFDPRVGVNKKCLQPYDLNSISCNLEDQKGAKISMTPSDRIPVIGDITCDNSIVAVDEEIDCIVVIKDGSSSTLVVETQSSDQESYLIPDAKVQIVGFNSKELEVFDVKYNDKPCIKEDIRLQGIVEKEGSLLTEVHYYAITPGSLTIKVLLPKCTNSDSSYCSSMRKCASPGPVCSEYDGYCSSGPSNLFHNGRCTGNNDASIVQSEYISEHSFTISTAGSGKYILNEPMILPAGAGISFQSEDACIANASSKSAGEETFGSVYMSTDYFINVKIIQPYNLAVNDISFTSAGTYTVTTTLQLGTTVVSNSTQIVVQGSVEDLFIEVLEECSTPHDIVDFDVYLGYGTMVNLTIDFGDGKPIQSQYIEIIESGVGGKRFSKDVSFDERVARDGAIRIDVRATSTASVQSGGSKLNFQHKFEEGVFTVTVNASNHISSIQNDTNIIIQYPPTKSISLETDFNVDQTPTNATITIDWCTYSSNSTESIDIIPYTKVQHITHHYDGPENCNITVVIGNECGSENFTKELDKALMHDMVVLTIKNGLKILILKGLNSSSVTEGVTGGVRGSWCLRYQGDDIYVIVCICRAAEFHYKDTRRNPRVTYGDILRCCRQKLFKSTKKCVLCARARDSNETSLPRQGHKLEFAVLEQQDQDGISCTLRFLRSHWAGDIAMHDRLKDRHKIISHMYSIQKIFEVNMTLANCISTITETLPEVVVGNLLCNQINFWVEDIIGPDQICMFNSKPIILNAKSFIDCNNSLSLVKRWEIIDLNDPDNVIILTNNDESTLIIPPNTLGIGFFQATFILLPLTEFAH